MLTTSQRNTCLMIARGDIKEEDLNRTLTKEENEDVEFTKEIIDYYREAGLDDLVDAMCVDE